MGPDPEIVNKVQKLMTEEFEANGLVMSEDDPAKLERKLQGVMLKGEQNEVRHPDQFLKEIAYLARNSRVKVWDLTKLWENVLGFFPCTDDFVAFCMSATTCLPTCAKN